MGGQRITGEFGTDYRDYLVERLANGTRGSADLCAYFFLRAFDLLKSDDGMAGLIATNTIAQGDTREVGLDQITSRTVIPRAVSSRPWPGGAALEVSHVWLRKGTWRGEFILNDRPATGITPFLTELGRALGKPFRLTRNAGGAFIGSYVLGMGFVLTPERAKQLIAKNARNEEVLFPYLNGEDLNTRHDQSPYRWIISFFDWPLSRTAEGSWERASEDQRRRWRRGGVVPRDYPDRVAEDFPDCLSIVKELVQPQRAELIGRNPIGTRRGKFWWLYASEAGSLYAAIKELPRVLAKALTSKHHAFAFLPNGFIYDQTSPIFAFDSGAMFAVLQSDLHALWALEYGANLETRPRYTPTDCFETFPFPKVDPALEEIGNRYHEHRRHIMLARREGLTKIYNRFHKPEEDAEDICTLRNLHCQLNAAVASTYGWTDLAANEGRKLNHDFHETKLGVRWAFHADARRDVLDRLLVLNHEQHAEDLLDAQNGKRGGGRKSRQTKKTAQTNLFD
jgi:hypothetical protein